MICSIFRLSCPSVGRATKFLLPKQVWTNINKPVSRFSAKGCHLSRLCNSGRPTVPRCITQDHYRISISGRGTISLQVFTRQFHTSGRKHVPPIIWVFVSYLSKISVALTGRKLRNWLKTQPLSVQKKHHAGMRAVFLSLGLFLVGFSWFYYTAHQVVSPIIGKKKFMTVTKEQYLKVAQYESENNMEEYKNAIVPSTDPVYERAVNVAVRLVSSNQDIAQMKDQDWTIHIIKDPQKNAFVLPNGHVFIFTGLLDFFENDDQFGVVLGHEMAHALLLHAAQQLSRTQLIDWFIIFGMGLLWLFLPNDGLAVVANWFYQKVMDLTVHMPYSRELEEEADLVGLHLAAKACFDVREGSVFWMRMTIADDLKGEERKPEWLSTHPTHLNRVNNINQLIPKAIDIRDQCSCPRLPKDDPRVKAIELRNLTDNFLRAKGSKVNYQSLEKTRVQRAEFKKPSFFK